MFRKIILPILAALGICVGIYAAIQSARTLAPTPMVSDPPSSPYRAFVAGAGLVESNTENIAVGTEVAGIVSRIDVQIGCDVKKGEALFTIDDRATRALLASQEAAIKVAEAQLAQAKFELQIGADLVAKRVISLEDSELRRYTVKTAEAQVRLSEEQANATKVELERLTVRAPVDGQVLQLKIHLGEFAPTGVLQQPLLLLGHVAPVCVRVNVDENEAWRVRADEPAIGFLRGNKDIHVALKFVRFEPYVIPKVSLTGQSSERVDTRVLQVIYSFDRGNLPIFVGQQMDVFIEAEQNTTKAAQQ